MLNVDKKLLAFYVAANNTNNMTEIKIRDLILVAVVLLKESQKQVIAAREIYNKARNQNSSMRKALRDLTETISHLIETLSF